jgi:hydroxyethylthiazole kinase
VDSARFLASRFSCVVSISGERDFITDGQTVLMVEGGSPLMPLVTGMGCSASAVTGAYAACAEPLAAAAAAMAVFASAGEKAGKLAKGPGTFLPHFLDELYGVDTEDAARRVRKI